MSIEALIEKVCADRELPCEPTGEHSFAVTLPGTHKLKTVCNLIVGEHALRIEAFVMRHPDEHREELWEWLLQRNARMYGVAFSVDKVGDVYLVGRVPRHAVTEDELDRLLGAVLTYADESFDTMLEIGFGTAIRREWQWRVSRGESLANLRAFADFVAESPEARQGDASAGSGIAGAESPEARQGDASAGSGIAGAETSDLESGDQRP